MNMLASKSSASKRGTKEKDRSKKKRDAKSTANYDFTGSPTANSAKGVATLDSPHMLAISDSMIQAVLEDDNLTNFDEGLIESHRPKIGDTSISFSLLTKRCVNENTAQDKQSLDQRDDLMQRLNKVTYARLDREGITRIDGLELIANVRNVYLQHNSIAVIENLEFLSNLTFLCLSFNKISEIKNLCSLHKLGLLDLSHNLIQEIDEDELPPSLMILDLRGNPCSTLLTYRSSVLHACPKLSQLDGERLSVEERRDAGQDVETESENEDDASLTDNDRTTPKSTPVNAEVVGVFEDISAEMFLRCQARIQQVMANHNDRELELDDIRCQPGMREALSSRASTNFDDSATPRINSPTSESSFQLTDIES